jgi:hypothetical protein
MRIYNAQSTYTNSYRNNSNSMTSFSSNNNISKGPSSFPSVTKNKESIKLRPSLTSLSENNEENAENSNVSGVAINISRPSTAPSLQKGLSCRTIGEPIPEGGACNLCYEPDSSGRLVEHFSTHELQGMAIVGRWTPGTGKKIAGFKFKRNAGRNVLIGSCSAGVQGRRNYCNGFCQFVKSAKLMNGDVTLYDVPTGYKAMPVDVYLYYDDNRTGHQTVKLIPGKAYATEGVLAVGCLPKGARFYERETVDLLKWLHDAESKGYSSKC